LAVSWGQIERTPVELKPGEGDRAVARDALRLRLGHAVEALRLREKPLDARVHAWRADTGPPLPDDLDRVAGDAGEALGNQVGGRLGLGARSCELGGELTRKARRDGDDRSGHRHPGQQHAPAPAVGEVGETGETAGHGHRHASPGRASSMRSRELNIALQAGRPRAGAVAGQRGISSALTRLFAGCRYRYLYGPRAGSTATLEFERRSANKPTRLSSTRRRRSVVAGMQRSLRVDHRLGRRRRRSVDQDELGHHSAVFVLEDVAVEHVRGIGVGVVAEADE